MNGTIAIGGVWKSNLRVTSKTTAMEFLKGVKSVLLIPDANNSGYLWRFEPGGDVGYFNRKDMEIAAFIPNVRDTDGRIAYKARASINRYLAR